jgi:diketogulonate reductase-like aldo/keto reductase
MGERKEKRPAEVAAIRLGLDLGVTLIDTAEMYGEGGAEEVIGEAVAGRRSEVFLVSKVYPHNATRRGTVAACERSLRRLKTDRLDLYLLHWRGRVPLAETLEAFESLRSAGKILEYGVSNFDAPDLIEASGQRYGDRIATDQVLYNLMHRGVEWDVLPWCRARGVPVMAYSPIEQGAMLDLAGLKSVASRRGITPAQVALAWLLHQRDTIVIPKASDAVHVRENLGTLDVTLDEQDRADLEHAFPPPEGKVSLDMK